MQDPDDQNDLVLGSGQIAEENVDQCDGSEYDSQSKPPGNPTVNANMDVIHNAHLYLEDAPSASHGSYSRGTTPERHIKLVTQPKVLR